MKDDRIIIEKNKFIKSRKLVILSVIEIFFGFFMGYKKKGSIKDD